MPPGVAADRPALDFRHPALETDEHRRVEDVPVHPRTGDHRCAPRATRATTGSHASSRGTARPTTFAASSACRSATASANHGDASNACAASEGSAPPWSARLATLTGDNEYA